MALRIVSSTRSRSADRDWIDIDRDQTRNIEIWKIKKLIKALESARGNGTSMISLIMPPRDQISRVAKMLGDEYGTASNIKSIVNRQSVLGAITSAQQRLKLYNKSWMEMAPLSGNTREILHKFTVDLPKKHGRGGQSALRFARLRMEKRHNYVRKTAEVATQFYINPNTSQPNVSGQTELSQSDMFDLRLQAKILLNVVDVSYGGENGFNQAIAIELSAEILSNVRRNA
ncbi:hypothetical protein SASPL_137482 [Salvia splendens]|uniref:eRF1/Pelota-like N-terminal domain-containing protein n=1 Tax=Salvia splendens TaxID=180675 RepID=A0A8X8WTG4_SALSN|nr:hypothetical protein SASPL_137482 [Salvia splendens]